MNKELVTIVIPIHLEEPSELEKISLSQTLKVLRKYPITFQAPYGLNTTWYENYCVGKATINIERFNWKGFEAYGVLQANPLFYKRFLKYSYILICHLDAFVFRDELEEWCQLGYDYTGSVIYDPNFKFKDTFIRKLTGFTSPEYFGNGGFGLKNVRTFYDLTSKYKFYIDFYHKIRKLRKQNFFDDLFFTQHFPKLSSKFSIAPKTVAQRFGAVYYNYQEKELPFNNQENDSLPFGVHGWIQYHQDYWKPCIRRYGYSL